MNINLNIDWNDLHQQKRWLLQHHCEEAEGLLNLIDYIQDTAVEEGHAPEHVVFPEPYNEDGTRK